MRNIEVGLKVECKLDNTLEYNGGWFTGVVSKVIHLKHENRVTIWIKRDDKLLGCCPNRDWLVNVREDNKHLFKVLAVCEEEGDEKRDSIIPITDNEVLDLHNLLNSPVFSIWGRI